MSFAKALSFATSTSTTSGRFLHPFSKSFFTRGFSKSKSSTSSKFSRDFKSIKYWTEDRVAHILLNRPERLNAIDQFMPFELQSAIQRANWDNKVHAILLYGAGDAFCSGYDLITFAEEKDIDEVQDEIPTFKNQQMPWDPAIDFRFMSAATNCYMEIWRSMKPVVAKIQRAAIGGGSDIALACDVTFIEASAKIGYPPSVIWGCPTTAFWAYRVGMERAKRILFTGQVLSGEEAVKVGLIGECAPDAKSLNDKVDEFLQRLVTVPVNQLWYQKTVVNSVVESQGLHATQRLSTLFDGMSRHTPEGLKFQERCMEVGFKEAVKERDSGKETVWSHLEKE